MARQGSPAAAPIVIPAEIAEQMRQRAVASYPAACCGLLFAPPDADAVTTFVPMENLQDRLHAMDPERYPRTSRNGFQMHALHVQREVDAAVSRGEWLLAFVHSHIGGVISFTVRGSREDASRVIDAVTRPYLAPSLGGVDSFIEQPALMSYYDKAPEELEAIGIRAVPPPRTGDAHRPQHEVGRSGKPPVPVHLTRPTAPASMRTPARR
jgi:proteasome lid subunit RPN8/RPN11